MSKALLLSVVFAFTAIPVYFAREPNGRRALKRVVFFVALFDLFYVFALRYILPRLY